VEELHVLGKRGKKRAGTEVPQLTKEKRKERKTKVNVQGNPTGTKKRRDSQSKRSGETVIGIDLALVKGQRTRESKELLGREISEGPGKRPKSPPHNEARKLQFLQSKRKRKKKERTC